MVIDFILRLIKFKMAKKKFWISSIIIVVVIIGSYLVFIQNNLSLRILWWGVSLDASSFQLSSFTKDKTRFSEVERLEAISSEHTLKIDRTKIADHKKYIEDRKFLFGSLFLPATSPYPEVITNIIECPDEFKPKIREVGNGTIYTLFAGERLNYGVCAQDLIKYQSEYGIFDCKDKGIFEIRLFGNEKREIQSTIESFKC